MSLSEERLRQIEVRANLQCGLDGDDADELLIEFKRLRAGLTEALDLARVLPEQLECGGNSCHCTACDLVGDLNRLLNPTGGETRE